MKSILVLGAGFVAAPLVQYLHAKQFHITIASHLLKESQALASHYPDVSAIELNVSDQQALALAIRNHSLVVSFVPYVLHQLVAEACIAEQRSLVTASYETPAMRALDTKAKQAGVIIVNEIGLDPGIDHLSAIKIFDEIHESGEQLVSYVSWCGGLPAVSANDNPLGYKFSWSPKSVLLALLNEAKLINNGEIETVSSDELLSHPETIEISESITLEGYPNRDSTSYVDSYNIAEASKVMRGTLRYPGFCEIMQLFKSVDLFDQTQPLIDTWQGHAWIDFILSRAEQTLPEFKSTLTQQQSAAFEFLNLYDTELHIDASASIMDSFSSHLTSKLSYQKGESDMVVMQHQFLSNKTSGEQLYRTSTLVLEGEPDGFSAMAKSVGTPAAIVADMILNGEIGRKGVVLPMDKEFYIPILDRLATEGIELEERTYTISPN